MQPGTFLHDPYWFRPPLNDPLRKAEPIQPHHKLMWVDRPQMLDLRVKQKLWTPNFMNTTEMLDFTNTTESLFIQADAPGVGICEILGATNGVTKGARWGQGFGVGRQGQQGSGKLNDPKGCEIFHPLMSEFDLNLLPSIPVLQLQSSAIRCFLDVWGWKALCQLATYSIGSRLAFRQWLVLSKVSWWRNPQSN